MALNYRNTRTGRIVSMLEPNEVISLAEAESERVGRSGTKKARREAEIIASRAQRQSVHVRHTLDKMDASTKWERFNPPGEFVKAADSGVAESEPKAADVRAWAESQGIETPSRGKLSGEVVDRYLAATAGAND